jgi:hypothetical protein
MRQVFSAVSAALLPCLLGASCTPIGGVFVSPGFKSGAVALDTIAVFADALIRDAESDSAVNAAYCDIVKTCMHQGAADALTAKDYAVLPIHASWSAGFFHPDSVLRVVDSTKGPARTCRPPIARQDKSPEPYRDPVCAMEREAITRLLHGEERGGEELPLQGCVEGLAALRRMSHDKPVLLLFAMGMQSPLQPEFGSSIPLILPVPLPGMVLFITPSIGTSFNAGLLDVVAMLVDPVTGTVLWADRERATLDITSESGIEWLVRRNLLYRLPEQMVIRIKHRAHSRRAAPAR